MLKVVHLKESSLSVEPKHRILSDKEKVFLDLIAKIIVTNLTINNEESRSLCSN